MNHDTDRIAVPTNGRKPHKVPEAPALAPVTAAGEVAAAADAADDAARGPAPTVSAPELTIAVSPAQLAVGFGVIAGLILLVLRRRRGRRKG